MGRDRVVVIGAGIGGMVSAIELALAGYAVTVLERAAAPGGKMRQVVVAGQAIDAGPTVFTMRWVFDDLFARAGGALADAVDLRGAEILARHAWGPDQRLDLFADIDRSADAIAAFAGPREAAGYRTFCAESRRIYQTLRGPFLSAQKPGPIELARRVGLDRIGALMAIRPFESLWGALGSHFHDPRLRQLFGRYATYCGSSPFASPATLMLIAHVEQDGVWLIEGGMQKLAFALEALAKRLGVAFRYGAHVDRIRLAGGRAAGVTLADGETVEADAVIANADAGALAAGVFGAEAARAAPAQPRSRRSLSATTWALAAPTRGFPLVRHNVFFSGDYAREFDDLFKRRRLPAAPTVYVCAQDRSDGAPDPGGPERLLVLVNAPATGDQGAFDEGELEACEERVFDHLRHCGLSMERSEDNSLRTTPDQFNALFPLTGGALYGQASHGWRATFRRPGARTRTPGLYLAGGSVHPGAGVPMAALSGRLAAEQLIQDRVSARPFRRPAMSGGMSTPSATTGATGSA